MVKNKFIETYFLKKNHDVSSQNGKMSRALQPSLQHSTLNSAIVVARLEIFKSLCKNYCCKKSIKENENIKKIPCLFRFLRSPPVHIRS